MLIACMTNDFSACCRLQGARPHWSDSAAAEESFWEFLGEPNVGEPNQAAAFQMPTAEAIAPSSDVKSGFFAPAPASQHRRRLLQVPWIAAFCRSHLPSAVQQSPQY